MFQFKIDEAIYIKNFDAILEKLEKMDPKLAKKFKSQLRKAIRPVQNKAKGYIPNSPFPGWRETKPFYPTNWGWAYDNVHRGRTYGKTNESRWQWDAEKVARGIRISFAPSKVQRQGLNISVSALSLQNTSVPGIIYELAGFGTAKSKGRTKRVSRNPNASEEFIDRVRRAEKGGNSGKQRLIYRAAHELKDQVHANLYGVLKKYLGENFKG